MHLHLDSTVQLLTTSDYTEHMLNNSQCNENSACRWSVIYSSVSVSPTDAEHLQSSFVSDMTMTREHKKEFGPNGKSLIHFSQVQSI